MQSEEADPESLSNEIDKHQAFVTQSFAVVSSVSRTLVILDSNVLVRDYFLKFVDRPLIADALNVGSVQFAVPEVVIREVVSNFRRDCSAAHATIKALARVSLANPRDWAKENTLSAEQYELWLRERLVKIDAEVILPDAVRLKDVLDRLFAGIKPFRGSEALNSEVGFKDTVIWLSAIEFVQKSGREACFITENEKDFWTSGAAHAVVGTVEPRDELKHDLLSHGVDPRRFAMYRDVAEFEKRVLAPILQEFKAAKAQYLSDPQFMDSLRREFDSAEVGLDDYTWETIAGVCGIGVPSSLFTIAPRSVKPLRTDLLGIARFDRLRSGSYLVEVHVPFHTTLDISVRRDALEESQSVRDFFRDGTFFAPQEGLGGWDVGATRSVPVDIVVVMQAVVDPKRRNVVAHSFIWYSVEEMERLGRQIACEIPWRDRGALAMAGDAPPQAAEGADQSSSRSESNV